MPNNNGSYNLFIIRTHKFCSQYYALHEELDSVEDFLYRDYSISADDGPLNLSDDHIRSAINNKIHWCHAVIVIGGRFVSSAE